MEINNLGQDRFLRKDPKQNDETKGAVYASLNPAPKRGDDALRKIGRPKGSEEDDGAPNVLTGTVITSCFIQTSALPSRIELQGNDLTFFDDTYSKDGEVVGDTSRLIFTHGSGREGDEPIQGFIMEKRASIRETYDNVLSFYALPPKQGFHNNMFIGRNGGLDEQRNLNNLYLAVDKDTHESTEYPIELNGVFAIEYSEDGEFPFGTARPFSGGASEGVLSVPGLPGYSSLMSAGSGGAMYWMYQNPANKAEWIPILAANNDSIGFNRDIFPAVNNTYDIGSPSLSVGAIYTDRMFVGLIGDAGHKAGMFGVVVACPLPTVPNALEILDRIAEPVEVGERGHFGPGIYFDDIGFPEELLYEINGKEEIEHTKMRKELKF